MSGSTVQDALHDVFLVDDSKAILSIFKPILESVGCKLHTFQNPVEAYDHVNEVVPECILTDYEMPEMTGVDLCRKLRADDRTKRIPIVFMSTHDDDEKIIECLEAGADDYLPKRTNPEITVAKVKMLLELNDGRKAHDAEIRKDEYQRVVGELNHEFNNLYAIVFPLLDRFNGVIGDDAETQKTIDQFKRSGERLIALIKHFSRNMN